MCLVLAGVYVWWPSEERVIIRRLNDIAGLLSVPAGEADLARVARVFKLREYLAPDIRVHFGGEEAASREAILGALAQWGRAAEGVRVAFVDMQVTLDAATPDAAAVYMTATITGPEGVDAREADVRLARRGGVWMVSSAESKETLAHP